MYKYFYFFKQPHFKFGLSLYAILHEEFYNAVDVKESYCERIMHAFVKLKLKQIIKSEDINELDTEF